MCVCVFLLKKMAITRFTENIPDAVKWTKEDIAYTCHKILTE